MTISKPIKINFADFWKLRDNPHPIEGNPIYNLIKPHFPLEISDTPDFLIYSCFGRDFLKYKCVRIFYTGENVRPNFDECDYAVSFDFPQSDRGCRLPLYRFYKEYPLLLEPKNPDKIAAVNRKFCNFIYSNKDAETRTVFFHKLCAYQKVDSAGKVLNNMGFRADNKIDFMRQYKFSIAFENSRYPGYTTEKILHAMAAGTVPIYWGNPRIADDFNPKSFINCNDYKDLDAVVERVKEVDRNDDLYYRYLREPFFADNLENEFVREENYLSFFEKIFTNGKQHAVKRNTDLVRWFGFQCIKGFTRPFIKPAE